MPTLSVEPGAVTEVEHLGFSFWCLGFNILGLGLGLRAWAQELSSNK